MTDVYLEKLVALGIPIHFCQLYSPFFLFLFFFFKKKTFVVVSRFAIFLYRYIKLCFYLQLQEPDLNSKAVPTPRLMQFHTRYRLVFH